MTAFDVPPPKVATHTTRVLRLRLKDKHASSLQDLARQVNFGWNYCNEHAMRVLEREQRFCSAYDIHPFLAGAGKAGWACTRNRFKPSLTNMSRVANNSRSASCAGA